MNRETSNPSSDLPPKLGAPAERALAGAGIQQLNDLTRFSEAEIKHLHGVGPTAMEKLRRAMSEKGLSFASGRGGDPPARNVTRGQS